MSDYHVYPVDDLIEHDRSTEDCVCIPRVEAVDTDDGTNWLYVHHSLDGRELSE